MASNNNHLKIHQHLKVVPPLSSTQTTTTTIPLTFLDIWWLRFHPVERLFFYTLPISQSHPSFFFQNLVPILKSSLSLTLQHFLPLAGKIIWPLDSSKPYIQFNSNDDDYGVSLLMAESNSDFNHLIQNSTKVTSSSRSFIPVLESTDLFASIVSIQITLFPRNGFSIGISTHHAVLDGKSSTMFVKAWAYLCKNIIETKESPILLPELEPLLDRESMKDRDGLSDTLTKNWVNAISKMFPNEKGNEKSLKILPFEPKLEDYVRATFELKREDLNKIKESVLSKSEIFNTNEPKAKSLSSFVLTCAYTLVCVAKAIQEIQNERKKFAFLFTIDCRARLEPPIASNYFGNCVLAYFVNTQPLDFIDEDGVCLVAKCIHEKIKMVIENDVLEGAKDEPSKFTSLMKEGYEIIGVAGSNRFDVYESDFGWGRPEKVEIVSIDRGLTIGLAESKDGRGGIEIGLVLDNHVMDVFSTLFLQGLNLY
ncbi:phenolic glucoside malonyltransferase 1-like [Vicia villosa]|uniref:phenolic glucoside malonyltransferase 1-like n=1 Tax=Vicia villosa TaxID=3911 RepID=UPI00273A9562|nr:phenolic glucoside malonyltransferase 1-like [Vicia villosa]